MSLPSLTLLVSVWSAPPYDFTLIHLSLPSHQRNIGNSVYPKCGVWSGSAMLALKVMDFCKTRLYYYKKKSNQTTLQLWMNLSKKPITKTCLYNFDPLKPHFYIVNWGLQGYTFLFLFLFKNIDCGYSLEPPRRGGSNEYPQSMF